MEPRTSYHIVLVQKTDNVMVHALLGDIPRQLVEVVCDFAVGKVIQKYLCCLVAAFAGCKEEWGFLLKAKRDKTKLEDY